MGRGDIHTPSPHIHRERWHTHTPVHLSQTAGVTDQPSPPCLAGPPGWTCVSWYLAPRPKATLVGARRVTGPLSPDFCQGSHQNVASSSLSALCRREGMGAASSCGGRGEEEEKEEDNLVCVFPELISSPSPPVWLEEACPFVPAQCWKAANTSRLLLATDITQPPLATARAGRG